MKFSKRTAWDLEANHFTQILEQLKKNGQEILDLTESNPTRCGFPYPPEILAALHDKRNFFYEPSAQGMLSARQAVCAYYGRKGIPVDPQCVFLTSSTSEAYSFLFRLLAEPGDSFLFPQPSYPLFQFLVDLNDLQMETYRLSYHERWFVDEKQFENALLPEVKGVVFVNPNNPTGSGFSAGEREKMERLCSQRGKPIIADEVFLDYTFEDGAAPETFASCRKVLTFVLGGVSKTLALPQMKVSWILIQGPEEEAFLARERLEVIADTYLSVNTPAQNALPLWLGHQETIQRDILGRLRRNRETILRTIPRGCECLRADGGWYAVIRLPAGVHEETLVMDLLEEMHVCVHPGYFFDFAETPFVVVSLLTPPDIFSEGLSRIWKTV